MRASAASRGYNARWRKARATYLQTHPLCERCKAQGRVKAATVVDHKQPHKGDTALFWDRNNWAALCLNCHNSAKQSEERLGYSKTVGIDGWPVDQRHPFYNCGG